MERRASVVHKREEVVVVTLVVVDGVVLFVETLLVVVDLGVVELVLDDGEAPVVLGAGVVGGAVVVAGHVHGEVVMGVVDGILLRLVVVELLEEKIIENRDEAVLIIEDDQGTVLEALVVRGVLEVVVPGDGIVIPVLVG